MKPAAFEYHAPRDVEEALALLGQYGGDAKVLAGGQSLVPLMNFRLARPAHVIDINALTDLSGIHVNGAVGLGAMTRQQAIGSSEALTGAASLLREATALIGHPGIRARGTVGGSLVHNDPAAEYPAALLALDASATARSSHGERTIPVDELLGEWLSTSLEPDELLTRVSVPGFPADTRIGIAELSRRHGDFALAGSVVRLDLGADGTITSARVVAFGGLPRATRMSEAEAVLQGAAPGEESFGEAASAAAQSAEPTGDLHASPEYRKQLIRVLTLRALRSAFTRET